MPAGEVKVHWSHNRKLVAFMEELWETFDHDADAATEYAMDVLPIKFPYLADAITPSIVHWKFDSFRMAEKKR